MGAWTEIHDNQGNDLLDYLEDPTIFQYQNGFVSLPQGPGLGIRMNKAAVRAAAEGGHHWKNPIWRNTDGTIAEW
jgi:galactonate dehydratase